MTIRYVRDGLRVVRVASPAALPPSPDSPEDALREAASVIAAAAAHLRADTRRRRVLNPIPPQGDWAGLGRRATRLREPEEQATGPELQVARGCARLSQRDLAAEMGFGRAVLADAERGRRSVPPRVARWVRQVLRAEGIA